MTYLIAFGWPGVLLSLLLNLVLGVALIHARVSRCARRSQDKKKQQQQAESLTNKEHQDPLLPPPPSTKETDEERESPEL